MIGQTISHYRITAELGSGGMGVVYEAEDTRLGRTVALKFLPPHLAGDAAAKARFVKEARAASALDHPGICTIHEIDETQDGRLFIAMACYEGELLADRIARGPLPVDEALDITRRAAEALHRAHEQGIVHRDIKPDNIFLTGDGQVKILDFGIAKLTGETRITQTGATLGTVAYMAPEQARGEEADARSDVWSLGAVLYEMLAGQSPFAGERQPAVIYAILNEEPAPLADSATGVPYAAEQLVGRCLAKDPAKRYASAADLATAARDLGEELAAGAADTRFVGLRRLARRRRLVASVAIGAVAVALSAWYLLTPRDAIGSIAVLPFANLSSDPEQEYLADGMTDGLITELQQLAMDQLRVISRTSCMRYKQTDLTLPEIAAELGVDAVVEASVMRTEDLVTVVARLIRARTEQRLWGDSYERSFKDIPGLQEQIARQIGEAVRLVLPQREKGTQEVDPEAYEEYLIGSHIVQSTGDVLRALPHFERAIAIDSTYAPAWTEAAHCKIMPTHHWPFDVESVEGARRFAERGVELDPDNAWGYYVLGHILYEHDFEFKKARLAFDRALEINPNHGLGLLVYSFFLTATGRFEEAADAGLKSIKMDPFNYLVLYRGYGPLVSAGREDEFLAEMARIEKLDPDLFDFDPSNVATIPFVKGEYERAVEIAESREPPKNPDERDVYSNETRRASRLRYIAALKWCAGQVDEAREMARQWFTIETPDSISPIRTAEIHAILGDYDGAMSCIERAYVRRDIFSVRIQDPAMMALPVLMADEPRYDQWLRKIGLRE